MYFCFRGWQGGWVRGLTILLYVVFKNIGPSLKNELEKIFNETTRYAFSLQDKSLAPRRRLSISQSSPQSSPPVSADGKSSRGYSSVGELQHMSLKNRAPPKLHCRMEVHPHSPCVNPDTKPSRQVYWSATANTSTSQVWEQAGPAKPRAQT